MEPNTTYLQDFASDLNILRAEDALCDVTIVVDEKKFPANRIVLAASSAYFRTMLTTDVKERNQEEITLKLTPECASPGIFGVMLDFIYSGKLCLSNDNCFDVLMLGCYLQVKQVTKICTSFIDNAYREGHFEFENPLRIFHIASNYNAPELKNMALAHMARDFIEVTQTADFLEQMTPDLMMELMERKDLAVKSEESVLDAVVRWLHHDWEARKHHTWPLLQRVRIGLISVQKVSDLFTKEIQDVKECMGVYCELLKFRALKGSGMGPLLQMVKGAFTPRNARKSILAIREDTTNYFCEDENIWKCAEIATVDVANASAIVINDTLYIVGGEGRNKTFSQYDPCTKMWISLPSMHVGRRKLATAYFNNYLYAVGGGYNQSGRKCVERFNFGSQTWQHIAPMPFSFCTDSKPSAVVYNDCIIVAGMYDRKSSGNTSKIALFDPEKNRWEEIGEMKCKGAQNVQVMVVDNTLYSIQTGRTNDDIGSKPCTLVKRYKPVIAKSESVGEGEGEIVYASENESDDEIEALKFSQEIVPQKLAGRTTIPSFGIGNQLFLAVNDYIHKTGITLADDRVYDPDLSKWDNLNNIEEEATIVHFTF